jgi:hypothetical protein
MNTSNYRLLIIASFTFLGLGMLADSLGSSALPTELQVYLRDSRLQPTGPVVAAGFVYLVSVVVSAVGLYRFRPWARPMALALTLVTFVIEPTIGPKVQSGWAGALLDLEVFSWGMVLALSYWSPLATQFRSHGPAA